MNILEHEIEDLVWQCLESKQYNLLSDRGLPVYESFTYLRQPDLSTYGRADIIGFRLNPLRNGERTCNVHIYEFKKETIGVQTFLQAVKYVSGFNEKLQWGGHNRNIKIIPYFFLIGKTVEDSAFVMASDLLPHIELYTYHIHMLHGVKFNRHYGNVRGDSDFSNSYKGLRDCLSKNLMKQYGRLPKIEDIPF